jgi:hypothetical protein
MDNLSNRERNDRFDDMLNDCYGTYSIGGVTLYPADILFKCDYVAYRCAAADYDDYLESEGGME